jgi:hypothetical protein
MICSKINIDKYRIFEKRTTNKPVVFIVIPVSNRLAVLLKIVNKNI